MVSTSSSYLWAQHITATITGNERTPNSLRFCIPNIPYTLSDKESSDKTDVVRFPCVGNRLRYSISGSLLKNSNYCQTRVNKSLRSAFSRSCGDCVIWLGARWIQCILPKTLPELAAGESVFGAQPDLHPSVLTLVAVLSRIYTLCWSLSLTPLFCFSYKQSKVLWLIFPTKIRLLSDVRSGKCENWKLKLKFRLLISKMMTESTGVWWNWHVSTRTSL